MWIRWVSGDGVWVVGADVGDGDDGVDSSLTGGEAEFDDGGGYNLLITKGPSHLWSSFLFRWGVV